jgi:predicted nucleic acid-binding protein
MKHVFVETNWVFEYGAPAHLRSSVALSLAEKASAGDLRLYIPSICLTEAARAVRKIDPRKVADDVRKYLSSAGGEGGLGAADSEATRRVLDRYEAAVQAELDRVEDRLGLLLSQPGIEVFALTEDMLVRTTELSVEKLYLEPFDQAILAAVLVRAHTLRNSGVQDISFCELDSDLKPLHKDGQTKQPLARLYNAAGVLVYGDFGMQSPLKRPDSPQN